MVSGLRISREAQWGAFGRTLRIGLRGAASLALAIAVLDGCADAVRLEPTETIAGPGATTTTGPGGGGGAGGSAGACISNSDCAEPASVCDTAKRECVECLVVGDCAAKPGTVCSKAECVCPGGETYCGPNHCVDVATAPDDCGQCGHTCFGLCFGGACTDPWEPIAPEGAPSPRSQHVAVWTGTKMVVWGGTPDGSPMSALADGGMYDLATRTWTPIALAAAPSPRVRATAVWTGTEMIVWGGQSVDGSTLGDGARFDPATNKWTAVSSQLGPAPRVRHTALWTGTQMFVWGGDANDAGAFLFTGYTYTPASDSWSPMSTIGLLPVIARRDHTANILKDGAMMVFGGFGDAYGANMSPIATGQYFPSGGVAGAFLYAPKGDAWTPLSQIGELSARAEHTAVFDGSRVLVFGGRDASSFLNDGAAYDPASAVPWQAKFDQPGFITGRAGHSAVWLEGVKRMIVWGGRDPNGPLGTGAVFVPSLNAWEKSTPSLPIAARDEHTAVSTGTKMLVWGGRGANGSLADGAVYSP